MAMVWIDADACMGAGTCAQIAPEVFQERHDGTWGVKEDPRYFERGILFDGLTGDGHGPDRHEGKARVPAPLLESVFEAAEECPAECIFVEA